MIRRRLVLGVVGVTIVALLVGGTLMLVLLQRRLVDNLDRDFRRSSLSIEVRDALTPDRVGQDRPDLQRPFNRFDPVSDVAVVRYGPNDRVLDSSPSGRPDDPDPLPDAAGLQPGDRIRTVAAVGDSDLRYRAAAIPFRGGQRIVIASSMATIDQTMADTRRILLTAGLVATAAIAGLSWIVVRRGFAPVDDMIETADRIAAGDLTRRTGLDDDTEVGRLGGALDRMLDRIEESVDTSAASEERMREFVAEASHELRTPLTSVRGYAELYRQGETDPDSVATSMERIESEATRMSSLVEQLLQLARMDRSPAVAMAEVDLALVVGQAVDAVRVIDTDRRYELDLPTDSATVTGDRDQLRQVIDNLLTNARLHTPPGTTVEIGLRHAPEERADAAPPTLGAGWILEVADDGPGVRPADRGRVFDRFWRAGHGDTTTVHGTGLGLSIVASIVRAHGGRVEVDSSSTGGARFTVALPGAGTPGGQEPGPGSARPDGTPEPRAVSDLDGSRPSHQRRSSPSEMP